MKRNLLFKLTISYIIIIVSSFLILNTFGIQQVRHNLLKDRKSVLMAEAELISSEYMNSYYYNRMSDANLLLQLRTIDTFLGTRIWIVRNDGSILLDTQDEGTTTNNYNLNDYDSSFLASSFSDSVDIAGITTEPMISAILPVNMNFRLMGYIVLLSPLSSIQSESVYFVDTINLCFLLFALILFFFFVYIYAITTIPLLEITKAAKEYTLGNFSYELVTKSEDEFADLSNVLNFMASELKNFDTYQKKFIANISHDFRSPLTSIKGYVEAMLDGTIPPDMHEKYLGTILFETERLKKLTENLLTLNNLDTNNSHLDLTVFDINHIIKHTAESFEGSCTKKKITLNLVFSEEKLLVYADLSKIQQVLYNLLDNAIKFSPTNSVIKISSDEKGEKAFISVKDAGIGIPKDNLKKIWDRFYKTDTSRGKDKKGTGLGLAIVKEILTAHGENIDVISTERVGTEFVFTLSKKVPNN